VQHPNPFVNVAMLQLYKTSADGRDVTLLIGERNTPRPLGVLELRVSVNTSVAN